MDMVVTRALRQRILIVVVGQVAVGALALAAAARGASALSEAGVTFGAAGVTLAALCVLTLLATVARVAVRLAKEADALASGARALGHGNLEARMNVDGLRELNGLGQAFNEMAEALTSSTTRLRDSESRLMRANVATRRAYEEALASLAAALDTRDNETREHSYRVMEYTLRLAREAGLPDEDLIGIERGALLHDIGKIGIPDAVLLKPARLSEEERAVMETHPRIGFSMLASVQFLGSAAEIVYAHHERWDGSGYPRGLAGEQIPVGARLFAVADSFDALTSDRPYRRAMTYAQARAIIVDESTAHFDPACVDLFLSVSEEDWRAIRADVSVFVAAERDRAAQRIMEFDLDAQRRQTGRSGRRTRAPLQFVS